MRINSPHSYGERQAYLVWNLPVQASSSITLIILPLGLDLLNRIISTLAIWIILVLALAFIPIATSGDGSLATFTGRPSAEVAQYGSPETTNGSSSELGAFNGLDRIIVLSAVAIIASAIAVGWGFFYLYQYRDPRVDQAFLMTKAGILLTHLGESKDKMDIDILAGMITALQEFVRDSFSNEEEGFEFLRTLQLDRKAVHFERGQWLLLALIYRGKGTPFFVEKTQRTLDDIETKYRAVLKNWSGDMTELDGVEAMIRPLLGWQKGVLGITELKLSSLESIGSDKQTLSSEESKSP